MFKDSNIDMYAVNYFLEAFRWDNTIHFYIKNLKQAYYMPSTMSQVRNTKIYNMRERKAFFLF